MQNRGLKQHFHAFFCQVVEFTGEWTEASAHQYCEDYISNNAATQACREKVTLDEESAINTCVLDIKVTGDCRAG